MFHADGQTDMAKPVVAFRNFANALEKETHYKILKEKIGTADDDKQRAI